MFDKALHYSTSSSLSIQEDTRKKRNDLRRSPFISYVEFNSVPIDLRPIQFSSSKSAMPDRVYCNLLASNSIDWRFLTAQNLRFKALKQCNAGSGHSELADEAQVWPNMQGWQKSEAKKVRAAAAAEVTARSSLVKQLPLSIRSFSLFRPNISHL